MGEAVLPCGISDLSPEEFISPDCMTPPAVTGVEQCVPPAEWAGFEVLSTLSQVSVGSKVALARQVVWRA